MGDQVVQVDVVVGFVFIARRLRLEKYNIFMDYTSVGKLIADRVILL